MVNQRLVNYIINQMSHGYSSKQIKNGLMKQGWSRSDINEAINSIHDIEKPIPKWTGKDESSHNINTKLIIPVIIIIIVIGAGLFFVTAYLMWPACGNGEIDEGETHANCCLDVGCLGEDVCVDNVCTEPSCNACQYLENHVCKDYDCCLNSDCSGEQTCQNHVCIDPICGDCQYLENYLCKDYVCCIDSDCDDSNADTIDSCQNPKSLSANCSNEQASQCNNDSDCDDNNVSTKDVCSGTPKKCTNTIITECVSGDGYCPSGCNNTLDNDCEVQVIDCGSNVLSQETQGNVPNFDCFVEASEDCDPAELLNTMIMDVFGMIATGTTYMELRGLDEDKCVYYDRIENNSVEFSDELVQQMLDNGATQEQIDQQEQVADENVKLLIGIEKTCKFTPSDLTELLNRWKQGSLSTEDFDVAECECSDPGDAACL